MIAHAQLADLSDEFELSSVVWSALAKVATKQVDSNQLEQGSKHDIQMTLMGHVDGIPFHQNVNSNVSIGYDQIRASSVTPELPRLVAFILSKLNQSTRDKLLKELPEEFSANDNQIPVSDDELVADAKVMLKRLRNKKMIDARGAVNCDYEL